MMQKNKNYNIAEVVSQFQVCGDYIESQPHGSGHIHDTFSVVTSKDSHNTRYILQRINHNVFQEPKLLMDNISCVTKHISDKMIKQDIKDKNRKVLTLIPTIQNANFLLDENENYWRLYLLIERARTYNIPETPKQVYEAAKAFGLFQKNLLDLSSQQLHETIPDFHNTRKRFQDLMNAIENDPFNRAQMVKSEIQFIIDHDSIIDVLLDLNANGSIPTRIIHNDTKLNNVMIDDQTHEGLCVIDLDTVMPGLSLYDYGDCVRSATSSSSEDERNLSKANIDIRLFEAVTNGYISAIGGLLSDMETELLTLSAKLMTLEVGIRFLCDHINGDTYFKTQRESQNLDRCRVQLHRVKSMETLEKEMNRIVSTCK